jgi:hypothetical protein
MTFTGGDYQMMVDCTSPQHLAVTPFAVGFHLSRNLDTEIN